MSQDITRVEIVSIIKTLTNIITGYEAGENEEITEAGIAKFRKDKAYFEGLLALPEFKPKYTILHNVDGDKTTELDSDAEFIHFMRKIAVENEDDDMSILCLSEAKEYLENYCSNLTIQ
jgi:hypothetical protein